MTRAFLLTAALLLHLSAPADADIVVLKSGERLRGGVHRDDGSGVAFNPYFSRHEDMVRDVQVFPRDQVKEVIYEEPPFREWLRRSNELGPADVDARLELAEWCKERKLKAEKELELLKILRVQPDHEAALRAIGKSKFAKLARGNPDFDPSARAAIEDYLKITDPEERGKVHGRMKRLDSVSLPRHYLDRIVRSLAAKVGEERDRPLTMRAADSPGVYTIYVPEKYDPRMAWPLVIGLHGGGRGGKDGDEVVGNGPSAMMFYIGQAQARGYIVVCPTAITAPWAGTTNDRFLRAILEEIGLLYHIDLNRVYLTGHSMGGFGTWHYGPRMCDLFAAISPMAGGGSGVAALEESNTPIFIFHGADDFVVGPGSDRAQAKLLAKGTHDFVYTELTGVGHGFPRSIQEDLFDFFDLRRLATAKSRNRPDATVRSSFLVKVSRDEKRYLGDPLEYGGAAGGGKTEWKKLLKDIKLGGGKAEAAADRLGELKEEDAVKPLGDLVRNPATPEAVQVQAARALGLIGHPDGYKGLAAGLRSESHAVVGASAVAMARIGAPKAGTALKSALGHLQKMVDSKRVGGGRIHISDWGPWLAAYAEVVLGVGETGVAGGAAAIHQTAVKGVIAAEWDVIYSRRVRQDPERARRALAKAAVSALTKLAQPESTTAIEAIRTAGY